MLHFFRKHQKFFFLFTTIIIISSFVFFGTAKALAPIEGESKKDERSYTTQMADFLNSEQWMVGQKLLETNFLNDGVISKEFLQTGMADLIVQKYGDTFQAEFEQKLAKEKNYKPYTHPYQPLLTAESMWSFFAPDLPDKLKAHQKGNGDFTLRNALFLAQKEFPPVFLSQALRYQEQNNTHLPGDPRLARENIALFGYQNLNEWFGESFVEAMADSVIEGAAIARKLGYKVSKDEVFTDLVYRSQEAYQAISQRVQLPFEDGYALLQAYLRQNNLTESTVLKIWGDVTLFRRMMHEVGDAVVVDPLLLSKFYAFAFENVTVDLYQMPKELILKNEADLKNFETYLDAVGANRRSILEIPSQYASLDVIETRAPELVGQAFDLYFAEVSKASLQAKVSVKETLDWECHPDHLGILGKQFPELTQKTGSAFEILEGLDQKMRKRIDTFARLQIVEQHPEWIEEALIEAQMDEKRLFLTSQTEKPLMGITDTQKLLEQLQLKDEVVGFTQDGEHFYRFLVLERGLPKEVMSYRAALKQEGLLEKIGERRGAQSLVQRYVEASGATDVQEAALLRFSDHLTQFKLKAPEGDLAGQFVVEKTTQTITRSEQEFIAVDEVLALDEGVYSEVKVDRSIGAYMYSFLDRKLDTTLPSEKLVQTQAILSQEARCRYFEKLLQQR